MTTNTKAGEALDLNKLEALAKAATPGPWTVRLDGTCSGTWPHIDTAEPDEYGGPITLAELPTSHVETKAARESDEMPGSYSEKSHRFEPIEGAASMADASFIAAANPAAILELIALARAGAAVPAGQTERERQLEAVVRAACDDLTKIHDALGLEEGGTIDADIMALRIHHLRTAWPERAAPAAAEGPSLDGKQVFEIAAPYFRWNAPTWHKATEGTTNMTLLLAFAKALRAAPLPTKEGAGEVDAKDAARYRWLRDVCPEFEAMTSPWLYDDLDKVIDAAIAAQPKDTTDSQQPAEPCKKCGGSGHLYNSRGHYYGKCSCSDTTDTRRDA